MEPEILPPDYSVQLDTLIQNQQTLLELVEHIDKVTYYMGQLQYFALHWVLPITAVFLLALFIHKLFRNIY